MSEATIPTCLHCHIEHVLVGRVSGSFTPYATRFFTLSSPGTALSGEAYACLDCGLVWSRMEREDLRKDVLTWGTTALKKQVQAWEETPAQTLLRPAQATHDADATTLLRPEPKQDLANGPPGGS